MTLLVWAFTPHHTTTILWPFCRDHPGEPVPEQNFWTSWYKGRLTEADTPTIRLGATPSRLTSAHLHHPPHFFTGRMSFLPPNQQRQGTEGNQRIQIREKTIEFSAVLPASSPYLLHRLRTFKIRPQRPGRETAQKCQCLKCVTNMEMKPCRRRCRQRRCIR